MATKRTKRAPAKFGYELYYRWGSGGLWAFFGERPTKTEARAEKAWLVRDYGYSVRIFRVTREEVTTN